MKSIRGKILASGLSITMVVSILLGAFMLISSYRTAINNMNEQVESSVKAYSLSISNSLTRYRDQLEMLARNSELYAPNMSQNEKDVLFSRYLNTTSFESLSVISASGINEAGLDVSDRDYFHIATEQDQTYISSPVVRADTGDVIIVGASKLNNIYGNRGAISAIIDYTTFSEMISEIKISETGYGYIVDKEGKIIAHPDITVVIEHATDADAKTKSWSGKAISSFVENMVNLETGSSSYEYNGKKRYVAYAPINGVEGWSLAVTVEYNDILSDFYNQIFVTIVVVLLAIAFGIVLSILVANRIANPIKYAAKRLEQLSEGDLTSEVTMFKTKDETQQLTNALSLTVISLKQYINEIDFILDSISNKNLQVETQIEYLGDFAPIEKSLKGIITSMNSVMHEVHNSAVQVNQDSKQVSANSMTLSQLTTEQAATVEEMSATISEITEQIKVNATNANKATTLAGSTEKDLISGNEQMVELQSAMDKIKQTSTEISNIINTIDDIAFQTNILALNASVEAARAGAAGKGFTVVAEEVKNLAMKSAESAKITSELIKSSIEAVNEGSKCVDETASSLKIIVKKGQKSATLIDEIATATEIQSTAVENIKIGMDQISMVTQSNSASAEEGAAASEELLQQAELLKVMVEEFKLIDSKSTTDEIETVAYDEYDDEDIDNKFDFTEEINLD